MRIELISKWFRSALIPAIVISSASFVLSGCGDTTPGIEGRGGLAPVSPIAKDKKAIEQSKAAILKGQGQPRHK